MNRPYGNANIVVEEEKESREDLLNLITFGLFKNFLSAS